MSQSTTVQSTAKHYTVAVRVSAFGGTRFSAVHVSWAGLTSLSTPVSHGDVRIVRWHITHVVDQQVFGPNACHCDPLNSEVDAGCVVAHIAINVCWENAVILNMVGTDGLAG